MNILDSNLMILGDSLQLKTLISKISLAYVSQQSPEYYGLHLIYIYFSSNYLSTSKICWRFQCPEMHQFRPESELVTLKLMTMNIVELKMQLISILLIAVQDHIRIFCWWGRSKINSMFKGLFFILNMKIDSSHGAIFLFS